MKVIQTTAFKDPSAVLQFEQEIQLMLALNHPNIVQIKGYLKTKSQIEIYLEYMGQGSIDEMLKTYKKFPEEIVSHYTEKILRGLEYLHAQNIVH